jgi:pantetheine-phosphate adenylyltransferase
MVNNPFYRYKNLLKDYIDPRAAKVLWDNWNDHRRGYHNMDHLDNMIRSIERRKERLTEEEFHQLILAAFFHDAIYNPRSKTNEDDSIKFFRQAYIGKDRKFDLVDRAIETTKHRKRPFEYLLRIFWDADNEGFRGPWKTFLATEKGIRKEFSHVPQAQYIKGRIEFLESNLGLFGPKGDNNIRQLIKYLRNI